VDALFRRLEKKATLITHVTRAFAFPRDPDDEPYLNLAIAVKAAFLISRDRDMLNLMTGHDAESKQFRQRFRFLTVIEPGGFLKEIERARKRKQ
jgi:predicted nucleic acid-binding protein